MSGSYQSAARKRDEWMARADKAEAAVGLVMTERDAATARAEKAEADLARVTAERDAFGNAILPDHHAGWDAESLARLATCHRTDSENIDAIERECHEAQARADRAEAALAEAQQRWAQATVEYYLRKRFFMSTHKGAHASAEQAWASATIVDRKHGCYVERVTTLRERIDPPQEP